MLAISFIHWVNRHSLDDRVVFARGVAAALICLAVLGSSLAPLALTTTLSLLLLALTTFETLYAHLFEDGAQRSLEQRFLCQATV